MFSFIISLISSIASFKKSVSVLSNGFTDMDFAATKDHGTFYVANNGKWVAPHPIHTVYFTDAEDLNPATILGYGTWTLVGSIPSLLAWGWKRTA